MGSNDLREMDAGTMDPSGRSTTNAGRICGIIAVILLILSAIVGIIVFAVLGYSFTKTQ